MTPPEGRGEDVLIVIPCLNEAVRLKGLIRTLLDDEGAKGALLVVADGGSADGSQEIVSELARQDPRVRLLPNPKRLQSAGVNRAAELYGEGRRWLVRVDAHAGYPPGYVSGLVETAKTTGAASVVVPMITEGVGCFGRAAAAAQNSHLGTGGSAHRRIAGGGFIDHGHHALMAMDRYLALGGYDESFKANEDAEFDQRLTKSGGRIWLADGLPIIYHPRETAGALFRQYLRNGAGRARTLLRHRARPKIRQLLPLLVAPALLLLLPALIFPVLAVPAAVWALLALGYGLVLGVKSKDACAALAGLAALVMHAGWSLGFWSQLLGVSGDRATKGPASPIL